MCLQLNYISNFSEFFDNLINGRWKPMFGFSHQKKIDFGNGGAFSHGISFNLGPQPTFHSKNEYYEKSVDLLMQKDEESTKNVLRSMTVPLKEREPKRTPWWNKR